MCISGNGGWERVYRAPTTSTTMTQQCNFHEENNSLCSALSVAYNAEELITVWITGDAISPCTPLKYEITSRACTCKRCGTISCPLPVYCRPGFRGRIVILLCFKLPTDISRGAVRNCEIRCSHESREKSMCDAQAEAGRKEEGKPSGQAGKADRQAGKWVSGWWSGGRGKK